MRHTSGLVFLALVVHVYSAPQFITFKEGKLGVNFGGYHAGVGLGGLAGNGAAGGLFAEAGTPHGQSAKAGLGGAVNGEGGSAGGGLFAGATAGGNVKAAAGLGGAVAGEKTAGSGFAAASAGGHEAASGLGGESSAGGSSGFKFSGTKSYGVPTAVIKETETSAGPVEHKVHTEFKLDNEIKHSENDFGTNAQSDVYNGPQTVVEKTVVHTHYKPSHHQSAYIGGFIGGEANVNPAQKRVDVVESSAHSGAGFEGSAHAGSGHVATGDVSYKEVTFEKNPNFFRDIFNIPISTLKAVGGFLSNTAAGTNIKIEKSDSIHAGGNIQSNAHNQEDGQIGGTQYGQSAQAGGGYSHGTDYEHNGALGGGPHIASGGLVGGSDVYDHSIQISSKDESGYDHATNIATSGLLESDYEHSVQTSGNHGFGYGYNGAPNTTTSGVFGGNGDYDHSVQINGKQVTGEVIGEGAIPNSSLLESGDYDHSIQVNGNHESIYGHDGVFDRAANVATGGLPDHYVQISDHIHGSSTNGIFREGDKVFGQTSIFATGGIFGGLW